MQLLPEGEEERIARMTVAELRQALAEAMAYTAASLLRTALVVRALEEKGEDMSEFRVPLLTYLRRIADGRLLPSVVARFAEHPTLISRASRLTLLEQERLASGETVPLVVRHESRFDVRQADPTKLLSVQYSQVFAADHLRSVEEQILLLEGKAAAPARKAKRVGAVRPDRKRDGLVVGRTFVPVGDVLEGLAGLRPRAETPPATPSRTVAAKLTGTEHDRLAAAARAAGCSMNDLVRRALWVAGLLD
jgi:hypothetical protein